ncbi:helix-turn-helix transcriptional regulator [Saccharothrix australiensis]|uniref:Helix-turn-helix protein n=1 Tax=Saccharothrix australiensis TaxID=2072 RepID=A0A495VJ26_9PSEU|nr:helix-turn-helix transcriptional regulator [Saccharothrix australiensis]RKT49284.1 hypothetical protein C8E97_6780 [Saccharothrix australiensis]
MPRTTTRTNGVAIRTIRVLSGLSVRDVVARLDDLGVSAHPDHIRNLETGARKGSREELVAALATVLDVPFETIASIR